MNDQLLGLVSQFGEPALFGIAAIAAAGLPLPLALLLLISGAMVSQGAMHLWVTIATATAGQIVGDQTGYAIGRWGGEPVIAWVSRRLGKRADLSAVAKKASAWGAMGIFLTRWLLTPLGPWVNLASGTARYPWVRFVFWDVAGEAICSLLFVFLGKFFSERVMALDSILGDVGWALVGLIAAVALGWRLWMLVRRARKAPQ